MDTDFTVGVEEEYQLVDAESGELRSRARDVLAMDWSNEIRGEIQETTLEIGTRICADAAELRAEIRRLRFQAAAAAAAEDLRIIAAGTHPFSRWQGHRRAAGERYRALEQRFARLARDEHNFGMHVHVAVPRRVDRIRLIGRLRPFLPHLLALAASSPFYEGDDTGYASYRMILWRRWPTAGLPPRLRSWSEFRRLTRLLLAADETPDERSLYWSARPHPVYRTVEFRVTDACPRLEDAVAIGALARSLVVAATEGSLPALPRHGLSAAAEQELLQVDEWRAARYGLDARFMVVGGEEPRPARAAVRALVEAVAPTAERLGDGAALREVEAILSDGNGAERLRRAFATAGSFRPLVEWLVDETLAGTGPDRRRERRAG